ncbi:unnamed protein product, partial [Effrenium voratum]
GTPDRSIQSHGAGAVRAALRAAAWGAGKGGARSGAERSGGAVPQGPGAHVPGEVQLQPRAGGAKGPGAGGPLPQPTPAIHPGARPLPSTQEWGPVLAGECGGRFLRAPKQRALRLLQGAGAAACVHGQSGGFQPAAVLVPRGGPHAAEAAAAEPGLPALLGPGPRRRVKPRG